jgi:hypothetical protein
MRSRAPAPLGDRLPVRQELILKAFDARHTDIARLVYSMYPTTSVCEPQPPPLLPLPKPSLAQAGAGARSPYEAVHRGV